MKHQMLKVLIVLIAIACVWQTNQTSAQQFDIGIFATSSNEIEVYVKPNFDVHEDHFISEIRYTIRWSDPDAEITSLINISPYNIGFEGPHVVDGGYRYQTFIGSEIPPQQFGSNILDNEEVLVSSFTHSAGPGITFELVTATPLPNTDYFFEMACGAVDGTCLSIGNVLDVTGILYEREATTPVTPIPLSGWSLIITIFLILGTLLFFIKKKP